jgi:hypothetical protein
VKENKTGGRYENKTGKSERNTKGETDRRKVNRGKKKTYRKIVKGNGNK